MVGYGVQGRMKRGGKLRSNALSTYKIVRAVLVQGLKGKPSQRISDAEVLGWWSVVHGLAFLAIDGHLGEAARSAKGAEVVVRGVLAAMDHRQDGDSAAVLPPLQLGFDAAD
jgi:hypothetical protein